MVKKNGFTLVELLVVIAVLVMLMGLVTGVVTKAIAGANETKAQTARANLSNALMSYRHHYGEYPGLGEKNKDVLFFVDGNQHAWFDKDVSKSTEDSGDLFYALEQYGNEDKRNFFDPSIVFVRVNGEILTLQRAREKYGTGAKWQLGIPDKNAPDGSDFKPFGVMIRLDRDVHYVTLPTKNGNEWVFNSEGKYE